MKRLFVLKLLLVFCALGMFLSQSALAQEEERQIPVPRRAKPVTLPGVEPIPKDGSLSPCPDPQTITQTATAPSAAVVDPSQLPSNLVAPPNAEPNFGGTSANRVFRHTFQFKLPNNKCCQCTSATLVLRLRALQDAMDPTHTDTYSSNDKWYIYKNGQLCSYGWVYDYPVKKDTAISKKINVPCDCLAKAGGAGKLTFVIQDDTSVQSATMTVKGCCVKGSDR